MTRWREGSKISRKFLFHFFLTSVSSMMIWWSSQRFLIKSKRSSKEDFFFFPLEVILSLYLFELNHSCTVHNFRKILSSLLKVFLRVCIVLIPRCKFEVDYSKSLNWAQKLVKLNLLVIILWFHLLQPRHQVRYCFHSVAL